MTLGGTPYDAELGKITDQDREYAIDLVDDIDEEVDQVERLRIAAQWLRKVRYEAVIADRKSRPNGETEPKR